MSENIVAIRKRIKQGEIKIEEYPEEERDKNIEFLKSELEKGDNKPIEKLLKKVQFLDSFEIELKDIESQIKECTSKCVELNKQKKALISQKVQDDIKHKQTDTLCDFLIQTILAPEDWEDRLDLLMTIPVGSKGQLTGGDYLEALYKLAFAIGCYDDKVRGFKMVGKKSNKTSDTFLNTHYILHKPSGIKSSGGGEKGIIDIHLKRTSEDKPADICSYKCGDVDKKIKNNADAYVISVKNFKSERDLGSYDILQIYAEAMKIYKYDESKLKICVCLNDADKFMERHSASDNECIKQSLNFVFGYKDLKTRINKFKLDFMRKLPAYDEKDMLEVISTKLEKKYPKEGSEKDDLPLYFHQDLISSNVDDRLIFYDSIGKKNPIICVGVLPRGGKSYIAGGIIKKYGLRLGKKDLNILFISSAVNETKKQFQDDLIEKFSDFDEMAFIDAQDTKITKLNEKSGNFVFASRELFIKTERRPRDFLNPSKTVYDLIFMDEAHIGSTAEDTFIPEIEKFRSVPFILLTATYTRPVEKYIQSSKDLMLWDLTDIRWMRMLGNIPLTKEYYNSDPLTDAEVNDDIRLKTWLNDSTNSICTLYGKPTVRSYIVAFLKKNLPIAEFVAPYIKFPTPYWISPKFTESVTKQLFIAHEEDKSHGFDIKTHFQIQKTHGLSLDNKLSEWYKTLVDKTKLSAIANYITPSFLGDKMKEKSPTPETQKVLNRIFRISDRPSLGVPFSVLFFLEISSNISEGDEGTEGYRYYGDIREKSMVWASVLNRFSFWRENFIFVILQEESDKKFSADEELTEEKAVYYLGGKNLKENLCRLEQLALERNRGLCIISGKRAAMGISLPCVDIVFLLNDETSADNIIQKSYRALTDSPGKKYGFIVDLNPNRSIEAVFESLYFRCLKTEVKQPFETALKQMGDNVIWNADAWQYDEKAGMPNFDKIRDIIFSDLKKKHYSTLDSAGSQFDTKVGDTLKEKDFSKFETYFTAKVVDARKKRKEILIDEKKLPSRKKKKVSASSPEDEEDDPDRIDFEATMGLLSMPRKGASEPPKSEKSKLQNIKSNVLYYSRKLIATIITSSNKGLIDDDFDILTALNELQSSLMINEIDDTQMSILLRMNESLQALKPKGKEAQPINMFEIQKIVESLIALITSNVASLEGVVGFADSLRHAINNGEDIRALQDKERECDHAFFSVENSNNNLDSSENNSNSNVENMEGGAILDESQKKRQNDVLEIIDERLVPDTISRDLRGEVFTPLNLVREMLFGIRKEALAKGRSVDKKGENVDSIFGMDPAGEFCDCDESSRIGGIPTKIWQDPSLRYLDPANGIGNFPVVAFYKLDYELGKNSGDHLKERKKLGIVGRDASATKKRHIHIIEKMLFGFELDKGNCKTFTSMMKRICPEATPNIKCVDSLTQDEGEYDIIMGNPPFQDPVEEKTGGPRKGGKNKLYERFTIYCLEKLLKKSGLLLFITPDNIFTGNTSNAYNEILKYNTLLLNLNNLQKRFFEKIGQSMCYFEIENNKDDVVTIIINNKPEAFSVKLKDRAINPIIEWSNDSEELINKYISEETNDSKYFRGKSEKDYRGGKLKVYYQPDSILETNDEALAPGLGKKKIILFRMKPKSNGILDSEGKFGLGPDTFMVPFAKDKHGIKLKKFFESEEWHSLVRLTMTSQYIKISLVQHLNLDSILGKGASTRKSDAKKPAKKAGGTRTFFDKTRKRRRV